MIKKLFKIIILIVIFLLLLIFYLSYFGVETSRFNSIIKEQIKNKKPCEYVLDIKFDKYAVFKLEVNKAKYPTKKNKPAAKTDRKCEISIIIYYF